MTESLVDFWNRLIDGEIVTKQDMWWALLVGMLFAALHLVTMLVTRWGDHKATSKSLIFSVLVHLSCAMGLWATNPPDDTANQKETSKPKREPKEPTFKYREVLITGAETFETDRAGNTPFFKRITKPVKIAMPRRNPQPLNPRPLQTPERQVVPAKQPSIDEPRIRTRPNEPTATPFPERDGRKGIVMTARIPQRIIDPTADRDPIVRNPSRVVRRISIPKMEQRKTEVFREVSRGKSDRVDDDVDLSQKIATDEARTDPSSFIKRGRENRITRRRIAPVLSVVESDNTGAAARRKTLGTGGGNRRPNRVTRIRTRPIGGVPDGSVERYRAERIPRTPRPDSKRPVAVRADPTPLINREGPRPNVSAGGPRRRLNRRGAELPATYRLRSLAKRKASAEKFGGTDASEKAVESALRWLARHQRPAGYWDADAHGSGKIRIDERGTNRRNAGKNADTGITALALLAFLGAGYTHEEGPYARTVDKAIRWIVSQQRKDGFLGGNASHYAKMYCHGMATYAIAEAYGMQSDPTVDTRLRKPIARAVAYILDEQNQKDGGWRYLKGQIGDMSMFGWQLMALKSAETAGLHVPKAAKLKMIQFLIDRSSGKNKGLSSYQKGYKVSATMTAEALFCKQIFRIPRDHPASKEAVEYLMQRRPKRSQLNLYYWYYGTLAMFQYGGTEWRQWNQAVRGALIAEQSTTGDNAGSWDPKGPWGPYGGRVYSTALSAMCLEVYYRFLPLYKMSGQRTAE